MYKNITEFIQQEKNAYFRAWRAKNKDKVSKHNKNYWQKRALKKLQEQEQEQAVNRDE